MVAVVRRTQEEVKSGNLLANLDPPIIPPKTIPDPDDKKPDDWVDEAKYERVVQPVQPGAAPTNVHCRAVPAGRHFPPCRIADPTATKPEDWYGTRAMLPISRSPLAYPPGAHASAYAAQGRGRPPYDRRRDRRTACGLVGRRASAHPGSQRAKARRVVRSL